MSNTPRKILDEEAPKIAYSVEQIKQELAVYRRQWQEIQEKSLRTIMQCLNLVGRLSIVSNGELYRGLEEFRTLQERLMSSLIEQINKRIPRLNSAVKAWEQKVQKMTTLERRFSETLAKSTEGMSEKERGPLEQAEDHIKEIVSMFENELALKCAVVKMMSEGAQKPQNYTLYLTIWLHEPYLEPHKLDELLSELDYLEKSYQAATTSHI